MNSITLDQIVRNMLLKRRYSIHYYLDFLIPAKDCLRELSFDLPMNTLRYKVLTLNDNNAIELPTDYQDYSRVCVRNGQYLIPLVEDNSLGLVPNYDSNFNIQPYSQGIASETSAANQIAYNAVLSPYWFLNNWNAFGENLGRQFGGVGTLPDTFKVNKARNEIKINENLANSEYVLEYIGNGTDADSATHIDGYAQATIEAYCLWQVYLNNRTYSTSDARVAEMSYVKEREVLRARLSDLSIDKFKRIIQLSAIGVKY